MLIYITDHVYLTSYVDDDNSDDSHNNPNDNIGVSNTDDDHYRDDEDYTDGNSLFSLFYTALGRIIQSWGSSLSSGVVGLRSTLVDR